MSTTVESQSAQNSIKCVVWDLDDTLWKGTLIEGEVAIHPSIAKAIETIDRRGILQSIASRNDRELAMGRLSESGLDQYFLYPQIGWAPKSQAFDTLAKELNIGLDSFAFIDDQEFERAEVMFAHPEIRCIDPSELDKLLASPSMSPRFLTEDSARRRFLYLAESQRKQARQTYQGTDEEFLATLNLEFSISIAKQEDLKRAEELTVRTHQMNTTGRTYSYEELDQLRVSPGHRLIVAELRDKFGSYGKVGLALLECSAEEWILKLLIMSCRVASRGVGPVLITHILAMARKAGVKFYAEFKPTDRNRMMYLTYKLSGFKEVNRTPELLILQHELSDIQTFPDYISVTVATGL